MQNDILKREHSANNRQNDQIAENSSSEWGDLLTAYDGHTITYDAIGNPLTYYNGVSYTFSWTGRRLTGAVKNGGTYSFAYNDEGVRTSKTKNGVTTTYYLNGTQIAGEETNGNITVYLYDSEGLPLGMQYHGASYAEDVWDVYWYEKNLFGDIVAVYDKAGTKLLSYEYDAYGYCYARTHNNGNATTAYNNPFRYRGYYYDCDLRLYYVSSRYYDPEIGRFINADSQLNTSLGVLGCNMFAYCLNNPVNKVDYYGNKPGDLFDTMDEAVRDAAEYLGALTWENTWEYSTAIYSVKTTVKTYKTVTKTYRFLWWTWTTTSTKTIKTKVTKYTYKAVKTDKKNRRSER